MFTVFAPSTTLVWMPINANHRPLPAVTLPELCTQAQAALAGNLAGNLIHLRASTALNPYCTQPSATNSLLPTPVKEEEYMETYGNPSHNLNSYNSPMLGNTYSSCFAKGFKQTPERPAISRLWFLAGSVMVRLPSSHIFHSLIFHRILLAPFALSKWLRIFIKGSAVAVRHPGSCWPESHRVLSVNIASSELQETFKLDEVSITKSLSVQSRTGTCIPDNWLLYISCSSTPFFPFSSAAFSHWHSHPIILTLGNNHSSMDSLISKPQAVLLRIHPIPRLPHLPCLWIPFQKHQSHHFKSFNNSEESTTTSPSS